jgi:hypothetical protein
MTPAIYNLPDAYRGDNYGPIVLKIKDQQGNYVDFTNADSIDLHVLNKKNYATALKWSLGDGSIQAGVDSITLLEVDGEKMKMPEGTYFYDLEIKNQGNIKSYLRGTIFILGDFTQADTN